MEEKMQPAGQVFQSLSGQKYAYLTETNQIFTIQSKWYDNLSAGDKDTEILREICRQCGLSGRIPSECRWPMSKEKYHRHLSRKLRALVLEVTQQCSLRCSYCIYSGNYDGVRTHSNLTMSQETMRKSIKYYAEHSAEMQEASISFYGGEALLHFDLICAAVEYAVRCMPHKKIAFRISSNGTTLTEPVVRWLEQQENVSVTVTLNGFSHDRYRRFPSGQGSLDCIMCNLNTIRMEYPKVWERIQFIANITTEKELLELREFYKKKVGVPPVLISGITEHGGNDYIRELAEKPRSDMRYIKELHRLYCKEHDPYIAPHYQTGIEELRNRPLGMQGDYYEQSSCCMPFLTSLFVAADGTLGLCERTVPSENLGKINEGINLQTLDTMLDQALEIFNTKCRFCWARRLCNVCFQDLDVMKEGALVLAEDACQRKRENLISTLALFCEMEEGQA